MRSEIITENTSVIAAVISALCALGALVYSARQEVVATNQLQATYLSNVFTKQVESISALQSAYTDLTASKMFTVLSMLDLETIHNDKDAQSYEEGIYSAREHFQATYYSKFKPALLSLRFVSPSFVQAATQVMERDMDTIAASAVRFTGDRPTVESAKGFMASVKGPYRDLEARNDRLSKCATKILLSGKPISETDMAPCDLNTPVAKR